MSLSPKFRLRTIAVTAMTLGLLAGTASVASATYEDDRATSYPGNAVTCEDAGLDGELLLEYEDELVEHIEGFEFEGGVPNQDRKVAITAVPEGVTVTGIVVKGGPNYNVYVPGENGLPAEPTWYKLRSPFVGKDERNIPAISHWYACGEKDDETTTTETTTTTTTTSETSGTSTTISESTTTEESSATSDSAPVTTTTSDAGGAPVTTTTETPVAPAGQNDDLASTGFGSGWLVGLGALLLAGGAALLFLARMRRGKA